MNLPGVPGSLPEQSLQPRPDGHVPPNVSFLFVLCDHIPDNSEQVAEALGGSNEVVFEGYGESPIQRRRCERALTAAAQAAPGSNERRAHLLEAGLVRKATEFIVGVVEDAPASVTVVGLADMDEEHPHHPDNVAADTAKQELYIARRSHKDNATLLDVLRSTVDIWAKSHRQRDPVIIEALQRRGKQIRSDNPYVIAAVYGILHPDIPDALEAAGWPVERVFAHTRPVENGQPKVFYIESMVAQRAADPEWEPPLSLLERELLRELFVDYFDDQVTHNEAQMAIEPLSDEEVHGYLERIDAAKAETEDVSEKRERVFAVIQEVSHRAAARRLAIQLAERIGNALFG